MLSKKKERDEFGKLYWTKPSEAVINYITHSLERYTILY